MKKILYFYLTLILTIVTVQAGFNITLAWDQNSEPDIAGYKIYYGTNTSRFYTFTNNVGNKTNCTLTNLTSGFKYYFAVTAYNTSNLESDFSNEVMFNAFLPEPPTGLRFLYVTNTPSK